MSISSQSRKHGYLLIFQECAECRTGHKRIDELHFGDVFRVGSRNFAAVSHSEEGFIFDSYRRNPGTNTAVILGDVPSSLFDGSARKLAVRVITRCANRSQRTKSVPPI
jgi:hypothetical protein